MQNTQIIRNSLLIIFILISSTTIYGQTANKQKTISFNQPESDNKRAYTFLDFKKESDLSRVKNLPDIAKDFALYKVDISYYNDKYEKYLNQEISKEEFEDYLQKIGLDSTYTGKINLPQDFFYVYVGVDLKKGKKYVVIDSDVNNDFKNDSLYSFALSDYSKYSIHENQMSVYTELKFNYKADDKTVNNKAFLMLLALDSQDSKKKETNLIEYYLDISLLVNTTRIETFNFDNQIFKFTASKYSSGDLLVWKLNSQTDFRIDILKDNNELENLYDNIHIGDTIILANKKLSLTSIKDNTLYLNEIGNFSTKKDDIYVNSLADGKKVVLQDLIKDKYVFIDFWGSWCGWCIKSMPTIKALYEKVKDRKDVLILGIAYENKKNNEDLKKIIKEKEIKFPNYYVYKENINSIKYPQMVYNISRYPTYLILDKAGNVVEKMTGSQSTEKIVASFLELINSNKQL